MRSVSILDYCTRYIIHYLLKFGKCFYHFFTVADFCIQIVKTIEYDYQSYKEFSMREYDIIAIGGGSGGIATMNRASEHGAKAAII